MTETDDRLAGRTRRTAKAPNRGKGLKVKRVFTTPGGHRRFSRTALERLLPADRLRRPSIAAGGITASRMARTYRRASREVAPELPWIDDPVSRWWVGIIVAVFGIIILAGFLLGQGGLLTPGRTPQPQPSFPAEPSVSASPGASAAASGSPAGARPIARPPAFRRPVGRR